MRPAMPYCQRRVTPANRPCAAIGAGSRVAESWALAEEQRNHEIRTKQDGRWFVENFIIPDWAGWTQQETARATT